MLETRGRRGRIGLAAAAMVLGASVAAEAGSIFMKNGYILQGPIVDYDTEAIILGWDNGKVTVYRRFIDSVSYDSGEKERIDEQKRQAQLAMERAEQEILIETREEEIDDLPADLDVFLRLYGGAQRPAPVKPEIVVPVDDEPDDESDGEVTPDVDTLEPPAPELADRVSPQDRSFSFKPPVGWELKESDDAVMLVVGPPDESGLSPSLNVVRLPDGLSFDEARRLLMKEERRVLESFDVLSEGNRPLSGGRQAFEVVARATLDGTSMVLRQMVVEDRERMWLLSGFTGGPPGGASFGLIEATLRTLEFDDR